MDTSPEYIKMCEKALRYITFPEDIFRGQWLFYVGKNRAIGGAPADSIDEKPGDKFFCCGEQIESECGRVRVLDGYDFSNYAPTSDFIPIWTQDQLQKMISIANVWWLLNAFNNWFNVFGQHQASFPTSSLEQLWLAFVMYEKFNKTWTGEEWL